MKPESASPDSPLTHRSSARATFYERFGKRALDVVLSSAGLAVLSPVLAATALAIKLEDGGPALFRQRRTGRDGQDFTINKFRSMPVDTPNVATADAARLRVTRVGQLIRRLNVDELPQLVNILTGDMSVVGPRPPLPTQHALIAERKANGAIHCRPGLTGFAQVRGYEGMSEPEKGKLDGKYAARITLVGDLRIIAETVLFLFKDRPRV